MNTLTQGPLTEAAFDSRFFGLIPAAGIGQRFGAAQPKQHTRVLGRSMLALSVQALLKDPRIVGVCVVVSPSDALVKESLADILTQESARVRVASVGGAQRSDTVENGLTYMLQTGWVSETDTVLVHDAARPGLPLSALQRLLDSAGHSDGALLGLPVADTLKNTDESGAVLATTDRSRMWAAQTPQMFRVGLLKSALAHCRAEGVAITDDASAVERLGHAPLMVKGALLNMKITLKEDAQAFEAWVRSGFEG